jgi:flagellar FliL protein
MAEETEKQQQQEPVKPENPGTPENSKKPNFLSKILKKGPKEKKGKKDKKDNPETPEKPEKPDSSEKEEKSSNKLNLKVFIIGIPVFIVQLILVYFITANFLINKIPHSNAPAASRADSTKTAAAQEKKSDPGKYIFQIEDVIVNPSDTGGKRLILTSFGFDVADEIAMKELKLKEVLLKDVIVTTISSKTLMQLSSSMYKDSLKVEIFGKIKKILPESKLNSIYISKYIIQ